MTSAAAAPPPCSITVAIPVYRDAARVIDLVNALQEQTLPDFASFEIVVVDDGSGDDTASLIEAAVGGLIRFQGLLSNRGRGGALNQAVAMATGDAVLFLDSDCLPGSRDLLAVHLAMMSDGVVASVGPLEGDGEGFWHRYQCEVSVGRARRFADGIGYSASSTNFMVSRWAFDRAGGFNERYENYGFEDRDLQLRLLALGPIRWNPGAVVRHMDALSLRSISRKMREAGELSSTTFAVDHPEAYRVLGYANADVRLRPWLRGPARAARWMIRPLASFGDWVVGCRGVPHAAKRLCVRAITGLSYLAGTAGAPRSLRGQAAPGGRKR